MMKEVTTLTQEDETTRFFRVRDVVRTEFNVKDAYVLEGVPTFVVSSATDVVEKLNRLTLRLASEKLQLNMARQDENLLLQVYPAAAQPVPKRGLLRLNLPLVLFFITIGTVTVSGYLSAQGYVQILWLLGRISVRDMNFAIWTQTALYTVVIMSTIGLHEVGHTIACRRNRVEASFPLFIPGIPGITPGTFGAVIRQKSPALNRNQLFDIGIMGPLVGFAIALIASFAGYARSLPLTQAEYNFLVSRLGGEEATIQLPLLFMYVAPYLLTQTNAYTYYLTPLGWAAWLGTLVTFLNAFPIGQLDGGHVARALFTPRSHRLLGYLSIGVMILAGWFPMALLVLLMVRTDHPGLLDETTPLSNGRRILAVVFALMFLACFTLSSDSPLLALFY